MFRKLPRLQPKKMLYSQALTGSQGSAPSASSTTPAATITHSTTPTTRTPGVTTQPQREFSTHHQPSQQPQRRHRNPDYKPNTNTTTTSTTSSAEQDQPVYVLTLTTTPSLTDPLTALRRSHFPRHLDHHPAHLTLFHALPGSEMALIASALGDLCAAQKPLKLATGGVFRMRRGVGINVADGGGQGGGGGGRGGGDLGGSQAARRLHRELQRRWWDMLSAQDRRPWRPHWTVQNKAADDGAVDAALEDVRTGFRGAEGLATGCALWRYEKGGRWTFERAFDFDGDKQVAR